MDHTGQPVQSIGKLQIHEKLCIKNMVGEGEMGRQLRELAGLTEDQSLVPSALVGSLQTRVTPAPINVLDFLGTYPPNVAHTLM